MATVESRFKPRIPSTPLTGCSAHDVSSSTKVGEDMISIGCVTDMTSSYYIATAIAVFVQFPYRSGRWPIIPRGTVL